MAVNHPPVLAPSILAGDHVRLAEEALRIQELGLKWLHVDVMDGHFVPNLTFGPAIVAGLRKATRLFLDVHLMLDNPHRYAKAFAEAGADLITIHAEPNYPVLETLELIRSLNCLSGIAINPDTPAEHLLPYLGPANLVLLMTVEPGFGGQEFRSDVLDKIKTVRQWKTENDHSFRIEVDGGVTKETARLCADAGADTFVAGTSFFKAKDKNTYIKTFASL